MFRERIRESAGQAARMLEDFPDIADNELRTKNSLIEPFLRSLGYDTTHPEQVTLEEPTDLGGKIDYVLSGETRATIAVEAKRAGLKLSDKETKQLRSYFTFSAAVAGILTNGVDYWLFTDLDKHNVMDMEPYRRIDIRSITENDLSHLTCLARREVSQDGVHHQARNEQYQSQINSIVAEELAAPSQEFLKLVGKKVGFKPLYRAHLRMLEPLVAEALRRSRGGPLPPPPSDPIEPVRPDNGDPPLPDALASLFGKNLGAQTYRKVLIEVVAELQSLHPDEFEARVTKEPFVKASRTWQYISKSKQDLSPAREKRNVGGYYLDVHHSARNAIARARVFLKGFGHDPGDLVIHTKDDSSGD